MMATKDERSTTIDRRKKDPPQSPKQNELLSALARAEYERLAPALELTNLALGTAILEPGKAAKYAYFPTTAIVSYLSVMENGAAAEIAVTGRDGVVGVAAFMGGATTTTHAVVQSAGYAYRIHGDALSTEFLRAGRLHELLLRYMQLLIAQMVQTAACNRHHTIEQQLCRWLLLSLDLLPSNELRMTQDLIANMLGVRRPGVSIAAGALQTQEAIVYRRGHITVLNRQKLERCSCECYALVKKEAQRLLPRRRRTER